MSKMDDRLSEILGLKDVGGDSLSDQLDSLQDEGVREPFEVVEYKEVESKVVNVTVNEDALDDYKHSRKILYGLIERGTAALEGALMVAKESENPRAYETASNIMNNVSQLTKSLIELQKALNPKVTAKSVTAETINVQNNNNTYISEAPVDPDAGVNNMLDSLEDE